MWWGPAGRRNTGKIKGEADISRTATLIGGGREKVRGFETDVLAIRCESGEGSDLGADDVKGAGDLGMKRTLQGPSEVAAMEEVLTK